MFLSYVSRTAPRMALIVLGAAVCVGGWSRLIAASAPPAAPVNLSATVDGSNVKLSWQGVSGSVYQLEAGSRPGATDLGVNRLGTTVVSASVPDGTYYVRVRAGNAAGMSGPSNELTLRVGCTNAPPAPIGLTAQVSGTSIMITWQKSSGASDVLSTNAVSVAPFAFWNTASIARDVGTFTSIFPGGTRVAPSR